MSMGLVFVNKIIMNDEVFPFPLLVTWIQFLIAILCFSLTSKIAPKLVIFLPFSSLFIIANNNNNDNNNGGGGGMVVWWYGGDDGGE